MDLDSLREIQRIDLRLPGSQLSGAQPNALAVHDNLLFVALAALSGVAVFQLEQEKDLDIRLLGVIPVGTFPTALSYSRLAKTLFIASGRNLVTGPNTHPSSGRPYRYVGEMLGGGIDARPDSLLRRYRPRLQTLAQRIYGSNPEPRCDPQSRPPIKYVFYVIKENRTYDQVFGDLSEGTAAPTWRCSARRSRPIITRWRASTSCSTISTLMAT